ncbi:MAG: hypothetical protein N3A69_07895 [Leptospiraceae bacterium]|nr:hypothetical protein [Leptospiraceae bacterium]
MKFFMKNTAFFLTILNLSIFSFSVSADIIQTKTGGFIEGSFVKESKEFLEFETKGEVTKIKKEDVKTLEIGYFGIPFCYKKTSLFDSEDCTSLLYSVTDNHIILAKGVGYLHREKIFLSDLKYFYSNDLEKNKTLTKVIKENSKLHLKTKGNEFILSKVNKIIKNKFILTEVESNKTKELIESEISALEWKQETKTTNYAELPLYATPGVYQVANDRYLKGFSLSILFFGSLAYAASQQIVISQSVPSQFILPFNNSVLLFDDPNHKKTIQTYTQNRNLAIGAAGILWGVHFLDVWISERNFESKSFIGWISVRPELFQSSNLFVNDKIGFYANFSLELKF